MTNTELSIARPGIVDDDARPCTRSNSPRVQRRRSIRITRTMMTMRTTVPSPIYMSALRSAEVSAEPR
jgi:hypothetical protein